MKHRSRDNHVSKIKYAIKADWVISKNDGESHWVDAGKLVDLYRVNPSECVLWSSTLDTTGLTILRPRDNGDYSL